MAAHRIARLAVVVVLFLPMLALADVHPEAAPTGTPHVVVYGTSWCGFCRLARDWFRSHNIPFEDRDIEQDEGARREVAGKCEAAGTRFNGSVPVLDVNGEIIHGFSVPRIEQALKHSS